LTLDVGRWTFDISTFLPSKNAPPTINPRQTAVFLPNADRHGLCTLICCNSQLERGNLMNTSLMVRKTTGLAVIILMLLTFVFIAAPISSSSNVSAQTTTRRYRRRHRSFWKKHRDKLTVAGTALGGAAIGGIAGGKKGAAIGALAGGGGGALYTYKLRKRHRHRRY
jgi:hypothetical protein